MKITIISVLYKDYGTLDYMLQTAVASSNKIERIIICDNGNNVEVVDYYKKNKKIEFIKCANDSKDMSTNHGTGINALLPMVKTPITALIEPDVLILNRGWDTLPANIDLRAGLRGVYGTQMGDIDAYSPCFMVGRTNKLQKINFIPGGDGLPVKDGIIYSDTGWRVSQAGLSIERLEYKSCVRGNCLIVPNNGVFKRTNEYWLNGIPVAAHLWRGSRPPGMGKHYKKYLAAWQETAEKVLKNLKG